MVHLERYQNGEFTYDSAYVNEFAAQDAMEREIELAAATYDGTKARIDNCEDHYLLTEKERLKWRMVEV